MKESQAKNCFFEYHKMNSKENTLKNYEITLSGFCDQFGEEDLDFITQETVLAFLTDFTEGNKPFTKRLRFSLLSSFFNFYKNSFDPKFQNPCDTGILRKILKEPKPIPWDSLEKEVVDEMIFMTENPRNRLMLELMARGGMRIGAVLNLTPNDIEDRKEVIRDPKSGKEAEVVFIPQKVADRSREYIRENLLNQSKEFFPLLTLCSQGCRKKSKKTCRN